MTINRPGTWSELIEMLFAGSWNAELQRFRSPYAFRGLACTEHHLSNSLLRLSAGNASITTLDGARMRRRARFDRWRRASNRYGTGWRSPSTTGCPRG